MEDFLKNFLTLKENSDNHLKNNFSLLLLFFNFEMKFLYNYILLLQLIDVVFYKYTYLMALTQLVPLSCRSHLALCWFSF